MKLNDRSVVDGVRGVRAEEGEEGEDSVCFVVCTYRKTARGQSRALLLASSHLYLCVVITLLVMDSQTRTQETAPMVVLMHTHSLSLGGVCVCV